MKTRILTILFLLTCSCLYCQVILEHLTKKDGLPSNYTSGIIQDNDGYIWIATPKGAVRYDGKTMKTYTVEDGLTTNEIAGFFKDGIGRIWFNCFGGKACYYYKGKITRLKDDKLSQVIIESFNFLNTTDTSLLILTLRHTGNCGIFKYYFVNTESLKINEYDSAYLCGHKSLGRDLFIRTKGKVDIQDKDIIIDRLPFSDKDNIGFISKEDTLYIYRINSGELKYKHNAKLINGNPSFSNKNGLITWSVNDLHFFNSNRRMVIPFNIRGVYEDMDNYLWLSTDNGVYRIALNHNIKDTNSKINVPIYSIKRIGKSIFFGSNNSNHLEIINNSWYIKKSDSRIDERVLDFWSMDGQIFKATDRGLISLSTQKKIPLFNGAKIISLKNIVSKNDRESYFCAGPFGLLGAYIENNVLKLKQIYNKRVFNVFYRNKKELVATTIDGLLIWKNDSLPYEKVKLPFNNSEVINHINEDKFQNLILSSNNGLIIESNKNYFLVDKSKGLLDNHINKTFTSSDGTRLYVCTNKGFNVIEYKIDNKNIYYKIKSYTTSDGLPSDEVNCALEDGDKIYIGTMEGLFTLSLKDTIEPFKIPIRLESLLVNDSMLELKNKKWNHHQNTFQFNFSAFYYQRNREMQFSYQLTPIDQTPVISDNPSIIYRGLAPGDYILKVFAFDKHYPKLRKSKVWTYRFTISPPYYKTWWFISLITLLAVSGGFLVYISYMRRKQKQNLEVQTLLKQMAQHRLEALKGQMNPHFIFNSLNTVQHFISSHNEREAMDFIAKFSSLIRKMLDLARVDKLSLEKEIQFLKDYAEIEQIRYTHKFDVDFIVEVDELDDIELPSMLVQPLLENAIKHGVSNLKDRRGRIEMVIMTVDEHWLNIKIKDNGNGLVKREESSKSHTSAALDIIRERLEVYEVDGRKGRLDILFSENGTVSELVVPI